MFVTGFCGFYTGFCTFALWPHVFLRERQLILFNQNILGAQKASLFVQVTRQAGHTTEAKQI